ncbi:serine/threonine-protein kinase [Polyangium mundeleinium]|uniref:Serine/threonine-protein kinase n=1 Tax=Polyangium mundeleinium TaxID=2995306 RepID=A0ABT5F7D9_9BACT|nr:serine/threonine-protein kinase [Polyangium mundeleinium]MDC0749298.1 serine/threonine-protein kinase [Polyangium mundeleinium]
MSKQDASNIVSVGDVLAGKYRVERVLGMGGMGVVVAATHIDLREVRAVKLMRPEAASDQSVERFLREARAVVRLRSEHVAEVYDVGRLDSGAPYIVMEMLEGQDLAAMQKRRGAFPIEEAVLYVSQACHALAEAHAAGIVHRDLKPGNLFLTRRADGSPCIKVLDFGISKHTRPENDDPEMTGARDLMGSPLYMAPEQMRSASKVCTRADVWALGAILYKLLTGRAPFQAATVPEIFAAVLAKAVKLPSAIRPDVPRGLDNVVLRCLDKQPTRRYASATDLLAALRPFGPWNAMLQEDEDATRLFSPARRSSIPPGRLRLVTPRETLDSSPTIPTSPSKPPPEPPRMPSRPPLMRVEEQAPAAEMVEKDERSMGPWEGSQSKPASRPARLVLVAGLTALSALAGAGVAAIGVQWPGLMGMPQRTQETRALSVHVPFTTTREALPVPAVQPPASTAAVTPATNEMDIEITPAEAVAAEAVAPAASASAGAGRAPVRKVVAPTTTAASPAKPTPPVHRGYDPFTGRH